MLIRKRTFDDPVIALSTIDLQSPAGVVQYIVAAFLLHVLYDVALVSLPCVVRSLVHNSLFLSSSLFCSQAGKCYSTFSWQFQLHTGRSDHF